MSTRTLELKPTADLPRWLRLLEHDNGGLSVAVLAPGDCHGRHLGFAFAPRDRCSLAHNGDESVLAEHVLNVGSASFEITPQQARDIRETFALRETP